MHDTRPWISLYYCTVINVIIVLYSTIWFALCTLHPEENRIEFSRLERFHLLYTAIVCFAWQIQSSIKVSMQHDNVHVPAFIVFLGEWIVAMYFANDWLMLLLDWGTERRITLKVLETKALLGILFYSYLSISTYNTYKKSMEKYVDHSNTRCLPVENGTSPMIGIVNSGTKKREGGFHQQDDLSIAETRKVTLTIQYGCSEGDKYIIVI